MDINKTTIAGIVTLLIMLSSGVTYYIQDAGTKTGCRAGWQIVESGEYEGYYKCTTASGDRYEVCFEVYGTSNTENYWCKQGIIVKQEEKNYREWTGMIYCNREGCN